MLITGLAEKSRDKKSWIVRGGVEVPAIRRFAVRRLGLGNFLGYSLYVEALGGTLELLARMPGYAPVTLEGFSEAPTPRKIQG